MPPFDLSHEDERKDTMGRRLTFAEFAAALANLAPADREFLLHDDDRGRFRG